MELHLSEILSSLNIDNDIEDVLISSVSTDSRDIRPNSLFVALSGDNFDGHNFIKTALENGAVAVIASSPDFVGDNVFLVNDTKLALLKIAGLHRSKLKTKIVGVTGSVGKTTTKELIACTLSSAGNVFKTKANLNNEIGLSSMLLELTNDYDYAVLELGVDGVGQMAPMSLAAAPDIALVTNIGESHIMEFKTRENIKKEKLDITLGLKDKTMLILNGDDSLLNTEKALFYGIENINSDIYAKNIQFVGNFSVFELVYKDKTYTANIPAVGNHNVLNASAAVLVAISLGIDPVRAIDALKNYKVEGMRQKFVKIKDFTVVEDCYNASPYSVKAAVKTLSNFNNANRRILVLSDMLELGEDEKNYHRQIGEFVTNYNIDILYTVGILSKEIYNSAIENNLNNSYHFNNKSELSDALRAYVQKDDIIWFKASRGMRLEEVIENLY